MMQMRLVGLGVAGILIALIAVVSFFSRNKKTVTEKIVEVDEVEDQIPDGIMSGKKIKTVAAAAEVDRDLAYRRPVMTARVQPKIEPSTSDEVIVFNIMAKPDQEFSGYRLLQVMLAANLRYGEMNIFHRYEDENSNGTAFSVACATKPGTFDLQEMETFSCRGLTLFMRVHNDESDIKNFKALLSCASHLTQELDGVLCNQQRQPLTQAQIMQYYHRINQSEIEEVLEA